jgi:hypothetical protein
VLGCLISELEAAGHEALALDLPIEDVAAGCTSYAAVVLEASATLGMGWSSATRPVA